MKLYEVTALIDGNEVVVEVEAASKEGAKRLVYSQYPQAHIIHVQWSLFQR